MEFYAVGKQKFEDEVINEAGKKEKTQGERSVLITFEDVLPVVNTRLRAENVAKEYAKANKITGVKVFVAKNTVQGGSIMPSGKNKLANRIKAQRQAEARQKLKGSK